MADLSVPPSPSEPKSTADDASSNPFTTPPGSRPQTSHSISRPQTATSFRPGTHTNGSSVDSSARSLHHPPWFNGGLDAPNLSRRTLNLRRNLVNSDSRVSAVLSQGSRSTRVPRMKSHLLPEEQEVPKPWLEMKEPRKLASTIMVYTLFALGIVLGGVQCYFRYTGVVLDKQPLCLVMEENFDSEESAFGPNGNFLRQVDMSGFGNGQFEMTTDSHKNSYVKNGHLYLVPTLTEEEIGESALLGDHVYNITGCTFNLTQPDQGFLSLPNGTQYFDTEGYTKACSAVSNSTDEFAPIINPIQSARIITQNKSSIRFGRVEVRAKMAIGDWIWPAIWLFPRDSVYGEWPRSGEIDMMETRGNGLSYTHRGANYVQGSLNWGPSVDLNAVDKTYSWWTEKRKLFSDDFHTYVLEWTETFLRIYVDSRLHTLLDIRFDQPFFDRGGFPDVVAEGGGLTNLHNPWLNGTNATPFDQEFFLIINVAVGGTNGWFPDGQGDKPWLNRGANPMRDFIMSKPQWLPTWPTDLEKRAMVVDYVKMYKHC